MGSMTPYGGGAPVGRGTEGHGSDWIGQNKVIVNAVLDTALLNHLHTGTNRQSLFPKVHDPAFSQVTPNAFVVTYNIAHPREASGSTSMPLVHSAWNGDGTEELAIYPDKPDLALAQMLKKWVFMGVANEIKDLVKHNDTGGQMILGIIVAGTTTHMARQDMYTGARVFLRLPAANERVQRTLRENESVVSLIPTIRTPETVWNLVSTSVKRYIYGLTGSIEARNDQALRKIDPGRNAYETFADTVVIYGLQFLKMLLSKNVVKISHPARGEVEDRFSIRPVEAGDGAIENDSTLLLGLAKAFGVVPPETEVPGTGFTFERYQAFHAMRKALVASAFYDGTSRDLAFHSGIDGTDWTKVSSRQTAAQRVTQAQIDAPRNLVAAVEDLLREANKWCVGTCIQGAVKDKPFRLHLK